MSGFGAALRIGHLVAMLAIGAGGRTAAAESPPHRPTPASTVAPMPPDACLGKPQCAAAGPFLAEVVRVSSSRSGKRNIVRTMLRFVNLSDRPIVLGYKARSGSVIDDMGNQYANEGNDPSLVVGIGYVSPSEADPRFTLSPGDAGNAWFESRLTVYRGTRLGAEWSYSLTITLLEVLPRGQVRTLKEYQVEFKRLTVTS